MSSNVYRLYRSVPQSKMQYVRFGSHSSFFLLPWRSLKKLADDHCSSRTKGSIYHISNICPYNLLPWEWNDLKLDIKWKYLLCLIFAHSAFLLILCNKLWLIAFFFLLVEILTREKKSSQARHGVLLLGEHISATFFLHKLRFWLQRTRHNNSQSRYDYLTCKRQPYHYQHNLLENHPAN